MKSYPSEPVGVVGTFTVTLTYSVSVYGDTEDDCWCAIEDMTPEKITKEDLIDVEYELTGVDSAAL